MRSNSCPPEKPLRVLLVDDDDLLCFHLTTWMERQQEFELVARATNGREAIDKARTLQPDVILMDLKMPEMTGTQALEHLPQGDNMPHVLILSVDDSDAQVLAALRAGARGFISKGAATRDLLEAIRTVARGDVWCDRRLTTRVVEEMSSLARRVAELERPDAALSEREREVLRGIGRGLTNAQIAAELFLSPHTVKVHVKNVLRKLSLPDRTEAARLAVRAGLVPAPSTP
jgi:DNA-binding NarL/FixJ family response regulator